MITCLIRGVADGIPNGSHAWKQKGKTVKQSKRELDEVPENIQEGEAERRDTLGESEMRRFSTGAARLANRRAQADDPCCACSTHW